jgi:hypothetical protein
MVVARPRASVAEQGWISNGMAGDKQLIWYFEEVVMGVKL